MTAETLKPFITPQNVESTPTINSNITTKQNHQRRINLLAISISTITLVLLAAFSGYTIWLSHRISNSDLEISRLNRVIESMRTRLGINYLDEMQDFEKQYVHALIDQPTLDDIEEDYDEDSDENDKSKFNKDYVTDDEDENYEEKIEEYLKKYNIDDDDEDDDDEETAGVTDDSLYNDFEKYNDSKKKDENSRVTRSIVHVPDETTHASTSDKTKEAAEENVQLTDSATVTKRPQQNLRLDSIRKDHANRRHFVSEGHMESKHPSPLRQRSNRRQKFPIIKSGESLISAKHSSQVNSFNNGATIKPAAHFHLHRKVSDRHAAIKVNSYPGDMYIGHHPSWSNEAATEHYFSVENGVLTVREPGLYYVYAQICYNNTYDQNGFVIFHNHTPFLQCLNTVPTNLPMKIHTCHTSGLIYLRENETIHLRDFHSDRNAVLRDANNRSYFGLMKV